MRVSVHPWAALVLGFFFLAPRGIAVPPVEDSIGSPEVGDARFGCWVNEGASRSLLLADGRAGWLTEGRPSFHRARYDDGGVVLESWGRTTEYALDLKEGQLHVTGNGDDLVMTRADAIPDALLVPAYPLPEDVEVTPDLVAGLTEDLLARRAEDQRVRTNPGGDLDPRAMLRVDTDNTEFLRDVIHELGWIDAERFGAQASDAAFLIVQHTGDLRLMSTALPWIERDVRAERINGQNYALLFDRFRLNLGYLQRYGSQLATLDSGSVLMPCEDIGRVDERRAEMGMGPLGEYLGFFRSEGDPPIPHIGAGQYSAE